MGLGGSGNFRLVLAGLGQGAWVAAPDSSVAQCLGHDHGNALFFNPNRPVKRRQTIQKIIRIKQPHVRPQIGPDRITFCRRHEQVQSVIRMQHAKAMGDRIAGNVRTTDVQKPHQAIGQGHHRAGLTCIPQRLTQSRTFVP